MLFLDGGRQLGRADAQRGAHGAVFRGTDQFSDDDGSRVCKFLGRRRALLGGVLPGEYVFFTLVEHLRQGVRGRCGSRSSMSRHRGPGSKERPSPTECHGRSQAGALVGYMVIIPC